MHVKIKPVFYCDFCKKHRLTKSSIRLHENRCFGNPKRECTLCDGLEEYKFNIETGEFGEKWMIIKGDECPACVLGFANQNKIYVIYFIDKDGNKNLFDYKTASEKFLDERYREENENIGH